MAAADEVEAYLGSVAGLRARRLAHTEWGITIPGDSVGGDPIEAGLRSPTACSASRRSRSTGRTVDPWMLLWWNRQTRIVRFGCTRSRDLWVLADIPVSDADERGVDRLLGLVTEAVVAVRANTAGGWLPEAD